MLNAIRRFLFNRRRNIYQFFDGHRSRFVDPLRAYQDMMSHEDYREGDYKLLDPKTPTQLRLSAVGRLTAVCRSVFGIDTAEGGGLTDEECLRLMMEFDGYARLQKKSGEPTPTSQTQWVRESCRRYAVNTNDCSGSISISTGCELPAPNPYVQVSLSRLPA